MSVLDLGLLLEGGLVEAPEPLLEGLEVPRLCIGRQGREARDRRPSGRTDSSSRGSSCHLARYRSCTVIIRVHAAALSSFGESREELEVGA